MSTLQDLFDTLTPDPQERAAERDADVQAVAAAVIAAMSAGEATNAPTLLSRYGAELEAKTPQIWPMSDAPTVLNTALWERDGFCVLGRVLDADQLTEMGAAATELIAAAFASSGMRDMATWISHITQVPDPADWVPHFRLLEQNPVLKAAAAAALGVDEVRCAWAHLVFKPPGLARPLPWHTDRPTWPLPKGVEGVAAWMSLDPLVHNSGGLCYAPGTHRPGAPLPDPVSPVVTAGDAILHHADVLHASGANRSHIWRRAWIGVFVSAS